jgi:putative SOS response-associated peptidase YedK
MGVNKRRGVKLTTHVHPVLSSTAIPTSPYRPLLVSIRTRGNMEGRSFPRAFERREKLTLLGEFYEETDTHEKEGSVNEQPSP